MAETITELVFSDSGHGALRTVKGEKPALYSGRHTVLDGDGEIVRETPCTPPPYTGPPLEGGPDDVLGLGLLADFGDIRDMENRPARTAVQAMLAGEYGEMPGGEEDPSWIEKYADYLEGAFTRLRSVAAAGKPIRIWHGEAPGDACGFAFVMHLLRDSQSPLYSVRTPAFSQSGGRAYPSFGLPDLPLHTLPALAAHAREIPPWEQEAYAELWRRLAAENAPLRAVINGLPRSVGEDFYDPFLRENFPEGQCPVVEIIGKTLNSGPPGVADGWYAKRVRHFLGTGELVMAAEKKRFYPSVVRAVHKE